MTKLVGLRAKIYSCLMGDGSEDKKAKVTKKRVIKKIWKLWKLLRATQLETKIHHLEKNKVDIDSFFCYKRKHKEFKRNYKLISKAQQRFKWKTYMFFT